MGNPLGFFVQDLSEIAGILIIRATSLPVLFSFGGVDDTPSVPGFCSWFVRTPGGGTAILGVSAIAAVGLSPAGGGEVW